MNLKRVVSFLFEAGYLSTSRLFNRILDLMDAKGHFIPDDFSIDLDRLDFTINYSGLIGSDLFVDSFGIGFKPGMYWIIAFYHFDEDELNDELVDDLINILVDCKAIEELVPEEFYGDIYGPENVEISFEDNYLFYSADSEGDLIDINAISILFQNICKAAGVKVNRVLDQ